MLCAEAERNRAKRAGPLHPRGWRASVTWRMVLVLDDGVACFRVDSKIWSRTEGVATNPPVVHQCATPALGPSLHSPLPSSLVAKVMGLQRD